MKLHADDAFAAEALGRGRSQARNEAAEWLRNKLVSGPVATAEVVEEVKQFGISEKTLRRAFKDIRGVATKVGFGGTWSWMLAKDGRELAAN